MLNMYKDLLKREGLDSFDIFIKDYETFEEIPLVSRFDNLKFLDSLIKKQDMQKFLIKLSLYCLNRIKLNAKSKLSENEFNNFFCCITFVDFDDYEEIGYVIPNVFVTRKPDIFLILNNLPNLQLLNEFEYLEKAFIDCGEINSFRFTKTINNGFVRVYIIPV